MLTPALRSGSVPSRQAGLSPSSPPRTMPAGDGAGGVAAVFAPVPSPGAPPGSFLPGVQAAGAVSHDGHLVAVTRLAHAVPGHPDGEVDTRPLRPLWQRPPQPWREPWQQSEPTEPAGVQADEQACAPAGPAGGVWDGGG